MNVHQKRNLQEVVAAPLSKEQTLWQFVAVRLAKRQTVILLVVVAGSGSSPGRPGFKMAVGSDGDLWGSIGGGIMEVKMTEWAKHLLAEGTISATVKRQIHSKFAPRDQSGMICSGEQTLLLFPLQYHHLETVHTLIQGLDKDLPIVLHLSQVNGFPLFELLPSPQELSLPVFTQSATDCFQYRERIGPKNRLYIVGAGHCALALSALVCQLDFHCCLLDDRPDLNTFHQNNFVHEKRILESYDQADILIPSGPDVFVVIMTLGYRSDAQVLRRLLGKEFRYLGLLGSAAKVATLLDSLALEGYPRHALEQIRAPIGLPIHSQTPEEIAVSIAAELILVKNSRAY